MSTTVATIGNMTTQCLIDTYGAWPLAPRRFRRPTAMRSRRERPFRSSSSTASRCRPAGSVATDVSRLFTNTLDPAADPYYPGDRHLRVSSHFFIRRDGTLLQFVPCRKRAWHAGASSWRGRPACNDYSVGIELEGTDDRALCSPAVRHAGASRQGAVRGVIPSATWSATATSRRTQDRSRTCIRLAATGPASWRRADHRPSRGDPTNGQANQPPKSMPRPSVIMGGCPLRAVSGLAGCRTTEASLRRP